MITLSLIIISDTTKMIFATKKTDVSHWNHFKSHFKNDLATEKGITATLNNC